MWFQRSLQIIPPVRKRSNANSLRIAVFGFDEQLTALRSFN